MRWPSLPAGKSRAEGDGDAGRPLGHSWARLINCSFHGKCFYINDNYLEICRKSKACNKMYPHYASVCSSQLWPLAPLHSIPGSRRHTDHQGGEALSYLQEQRCGGAPHAPSSSQPEGGSGGIGCLEGALYKATTVPRPAAGPGPALHQHTPFASSSCSVAFRCPLPCNVTGTGLPACFADKPVSHSDGHTLFGRVFLILDSRTSSLGFAPLLWLLYTTLNPSLTPGVSVTFTHVTVTFFSRPKLHVAGSVLSLSPSPVLSDWLSCSHSGLCLSLPSMEVSPLNVCGPFLKELRVQKMYQIRRNIPKPTISR